jgi:uncharacterized protein
MTMFPDSTRRTLDYGRADTGEATRRAFFNQVYLWMAVGLILTACVSATVAWTPAINGVLYGASLGIIPTIVMFVGLLAIGWTFNSVVFKISLTAATILYLLYCTIMGGLISYIWMVYRIETIGAAFVLTGGIFGIMSFIGFVTKVDLSKMGSLLMMAVIGMVLASVVNIFLANSALSWAITYISVVVFVGLVAYFTQDLKNKADMYGNDPVLAPKLALVGSFELYWAFINLFLALLRILGSRK